MNNSSEDYAYIPTGNYQSHSVLRNSSQIPTIPPTPAPRSINDIQSEARDRFAGIIWIQKDISHTLEDYFIDYDYWEIYSETKSYSKRTYQAAYKGIMREYHNYLCILNSDDGEEFYVVAKRVRSELEQLEPYCRCLRCVSSVFNPMKYIWCDYCTKCIKAGPGFTKPEYITQAKQLKETQDKQKSVPSKYGKYFQGTHPMKTIEYVIIGILLITVIWLRM